MERFNDTLKRYPEKLHQFFFEFFFTFHCPYNNVKDEDDKDFILGVKYYKKPQKYSESLKKVASKIDANENDYRLKLFNAMLEDFLKDQQQSILMEFDTTKVFKELSDLVTQFYSVHYNSYI